MSKRFMLDDAGELIDMSNHQFIDYGQEVLELLNELNDENVNLKQRLKVCEDFVERNWFKIHKKEEINNE